jgi:hypothetical protein
MSYQRLPIEKYPNTGDLFRRSTVAPDCSDSALIDLMMSVIEMFRQRRAGLAATFRYHGSGKMFTVIRLWCVRLAHPKNFKRTC